MDNKLGYMIAIVVVAGVLVFGVATIVQQGHSSATGPCVESGATHKVVIQNSTAAPSQTKAARCDLLVITNKDAVTREIAFGDHDHHVAYDGVEEKEVRQNESVTITLDQTGEFHFHDHLHDEVEGYFTVTR